MKRKIRMIIMSSLFCLLSAKAPAQQNPGEVIWGYGPDNGPDKWGSLSVPFEMCVNGKSQSPIDITGSIPSEKNTLQINYTSAPLNIMNDGYTTLTMDQQTLVVNLGRSVQINFAPDAHESIKLGDTTYRLLQFHFHTPGEHHLHGQKFPAEIHFFNQGPSNVAVIAVFIKPGKDNPNLQRILDHLPKVRGEAENVANVAIDPSQLLPSNKSYYTYAGSLTTPPCLENVKWVVMENPIEASPAQIQKIRAAIGEDNSRPLQPLNDRRILYVKVP